MPTTKTPEETMFLAESLVRSINSPVCIALFGELGAGKTVFVKGLAKGLGIEDVIKSPTFVLMRSYSGRMKLRHIDLYRIKKEEEFLPFEEALMDEGITAIEWAERAGELLPEKRIDVIFKILHENNREIIINDYRN
ncbi:tRNA (adenosine(37)-N6)-threonylcarbamoyltransferase complex ATPase subunit type 1 TsaE [candidate division WOR-3 bacterium]|nr:tRNA (adenosine(37)-N6)-threonylcarbamoyltransferase complex ATPase subunit type 1 TsaE [candidate division WOR-3 bacterium]